MASVSLLTLVMDGLMVSRIMHSWRKGGWRGDVVRGDVVRDQLILDVASKIMEKSIVLRLQITVALKGLSAKFP